MNTKVLVTGGAGFVGSHVNKALNDKGFATVILDDLSRGTKESVIAGTLIEADFGDQEVLRTIFNDHEISSVMHFAAFTDVGESVDQPLLYIRNNVVKTITLLNTMLEAGVKNFVFSSSAAVYGIPRFGRVTEGAEKKPINPYGMTKLEVEAILEQYGRDYGLHSCSLRYFNAAGGDPEGVLKNFKKKESNLIPIVLRSLIGKKEVTIFGTDYETPDGTCIRDYIHVMDLADAHILAMQTLKGVSAYNLGNGAGASVREVIDMAEKVTGKKVKVKEGPRRAGDPPTLIADATQAREELNWEPQFPDLESIVKDAWNSYQFTAV